MNFDFLYQQDYINALSHNDYYHFGKIPIEPPSWEEILLDFDREYKVHKEYEDNNIFKYQKDLGFILHDFKKVNAVDALLSEIKKHQNKDNRIYTAYCFISMTTLTETYGRHNDIMDVWFWQLKGYTLFQVEGRYRNFEKVLEPGELLHIPRGMWHNTKPMSSRVGVSLVSEEVSESNV